MLEEKKILVLIKSRYHLIAAREVFSENYTVQIASFDKFDPDRIAELPGVIYMQSDVYQGEESDLVRALRAHVRFRKIPILGFFENISAAQKYLALDEGVTEMIAHPQMAAEMRAKLNTYFQLHQSERLIESLSGDIQKLSQFFSDDVVRKILCEQNNQEVYGEHVSATVFFLDIRNFTTLSEKHEPQVIARLLNRLYTDIMDLILSHRGSVNKIIGDALLATFGCPVAYGDDAVNAVRCALAIRDTIANFNQTLPDYLSEPIAIGMGIATGRVFAGTIGSFRRMDYTVIGDTVNIASRLEGLTKKTRFDLIVDKKTKELCGGLIQAKRLSLNRVRGRSNLLEIYLVEGLTECETDQTETQTFLFRSA